MTAASTPTPPDWHCLALGDLVTIVGRQVDPSEEPTREFNYVSLDHIEAGTGRIVDFGPTQGREISSNKISFQRGDILYGRLRPYLQKVIIAPFDGIAATELLPLRAHGAIDPEFLREVLLGPDHLAEVTQMMSGARMPRVRSEELLRVRIPVPPLHEQRRIVRALSVFRYRAVNLRRKLARGAELVHDYEQSFLTSVYSGELSASLREPSESDQNGEALLKHVLAKRRATWEVAETNRLRSEGRLPRNDGWKKRYPEPSAIEAKNLAPLAPGWSWASLSQLSSAAEPLCYGVVQPGDEVEDGVRLIRVQDLQDGTVREDRLRQVSSTIDEIHSRSRLRGAEVLVSLVGTIGRVAVVPTRLAGANIARALAKVTPGDSIPSRWIAFALQTPRLQNWMAHSARGVARNTLNLSLLAQAPIPLAPAEEAEWLLRQIDIRQVGIGSVRQKFADMLAALGKLITSAQARSLSGALILSDPGDEAFATARLEHFENSGRQDSVRKGGRKVVTRTKLRGSDRHAPKRDLATVLEENSGGLDPLRLLEAAGYALEEVEAFYKALATAVVEERIREERPDSESTLLVVA